MISGILAAQGLYAGKLLENNNGFIIPLASSATLTSYFTLQQRNGYDCGVFILAIVKELIKCNPNQA